jgi:phi13 family phage major tail protein
MNRTEYGLSDCYYSVYANGTYQSPVRIPGAVSLEVSSGSTISTAKSRFFTLPVGCTVGGYSGTLEIANIPQSFFQDVLGYSVDSSGVVIEKNKKKKVHFALLHQTKGTAENVRYCWYNCFCPGVDFSRSQSMASIKIPLTIADKGGIIRAFATENNGKYKSWFDEVYL